MKIYNFEMNGGTKKAIAVSGIGLVASGLGYIVTQASKVEPLISKVEGIDNTQLERAKIQDERSKNQDAWNNLFLENFKRIDAKQDKILEKLNGGT